jgi:hypothetical protein
MVCLVWQRNNETKERREDVRNTRHRTDPGIRWDMDMLVNSLSPWWEVRLGRHRSSSLLRRALRDVHHPHLHDYLGIEPSKGWQKLARGEQCTLSEF